LILSLYSGSPMRINGVHIALLELESLS